MACTDSRRGNLMGLLDEVRAESNPPRRTKLDEIKETLTEEDFEEFMVAMLDTQVSQMSLVRALQKRGIHIGTGTISELRRKLLRGDV